MEQTKTMRIKFLLLAALCSFSFQGISQTLCVETGSPTGGSPGSASANFAQSITMGSCTGLFAGITVDGSTIFGAGNPVWTLDIFQGNGFGGTLQYTQTGIALTNAGAGYIFINIEGGSGSRAFTSGNQYTFRISTATAMNTVVVFRNNTSFYSGGQGYLDGAAFGTGGDILDVNIFTETATSSCGGATRLYVKHNASGTNNGTSWTNAYTNLQSAIDFARGCSNIQEIWVSSGTYKPSKDKSGNASPGNATSKTFYINFPVTIYGGFAGTETSLSQRNLVSNVTILSGDLDNNDTASPAVTAANVQGANANIVVHIQNVATGFTADGFTITAAQFASGFAGGGIHNEGTGFPFGVNSTFRNCKIQGNAGPGIFNSGNLGNNSSGRAILVVENSTISGNSEDFYAPGIFSNSNGGYTNTTVNNCTFSNNTSTGTSNSGAYMESAPSGNGAATFSKCIFSSNSATANGAAVHANGTSVGTVNISFSNCIFMNNTAGGKGGAYYATGSSSGNVSSGFTNCTFYNNSATNGGSAVASTTNNLNAPTLLLRNCILWQNTNEILNEGVASTTLSYSLINGASAPAGTATDNSLFNTNPNFVNAAGGNLRLQDCSPAVNSGTSTGAPATDLDNNPRPALGGFDMGAYESQSGGGTTTYYRDMDGDTFGNPAMTQVACSPPMGYVTNNTDCDDNDPLEKPGQIWYDDTDNDGYGQTGASPLTQCLRPTGYRAAVELLATTGDCNDNNAAIKPGATEVCDGVDNDCDGMTDEGLLTTYYRDFDGDTFGNPAMTQLTCSQPTGYVTNNTDCDDNDALEKPGQVWYKDTDNDGYGQTGAASITQCLRPTGYKVATELLATSGDCNDNNAAIKPGATEICDGVDNDCDGMTDEGLLTTYYRDMDGDAFGNPAMTQQACSQPVGYVTNNTDCDDNDPLEKPGQVWYKDTDNDGYGQTGAASITQCLRPTGYKAAIELTAITGDCNDAVATINPGATEVCDSVDNDCDGMTDEGGLTTYYRDMDGDTFGNPAMTQQACSQPIGYVINNTDCDDNDPLEKPGQVWYDDTDNDGYGQTGAASITQCLRPTGYKAAIELTATTGDCNDAVATINPGATEVCDGVDNDCDGSTDEGVLTTYYRDMDGDTFGNPAMTQQACSQPVGYVTNNTDCDDNDALEKPGQVWYKDTDNDGYGQTGAATITQCLRPAGYKVASELTATTGDCNDAVAAINPAATEICDEIDNDCDGSTDEGVQTTYYEDTDMDGFGDPNSFTMACSLPTGYVANDDDCDDMDALEFPGQVWYKDADGDDYSDGATLTQCLRPTNYFVASELIATSGDCNDAVATINPAATEICDGIDNNCDGMIDNGALTTYYQDSDGDGFGNPAASQQACAPPIGYVTNNTDCDDTDELEFPGQVWFKDADGDDYSDGTTLTQCTRPANHFAASELTATSGDCNDAVAAINPAAAEICDEIDNDCDGSTDEGVQTTYYRDMDGDGFGNPSNTTMACSLPTGYVTNNTDCDDTDPLEKPGQVWYKDADGDDYSDGMTLTQCLRPTNYFVVSELIATSGDCNDAVATIN
ncbi:MAG: MopE-related protein, partial [Saprospiraceae bacterium]